MFKFPPKQPYERLDYDVEFNRFLSRGDRLVSASVSIEVVSGSDDAVSMQEDGIDLTDKIVRVWLRDGLDDVDYKVTVRAVTEQARNKEFEFLLRVRER